MAGSDDLSKVLDDAYPLCPSRGEQLQDAGDVYRPHLFCPRCRVSVLVRPEA